MHENMPIVSVVMPVYNGEKYLSEAIDSIISQTFTDWEFIIVNEFGSNKETTSILHKYEEKDTRIKILQNEQRLGIAASLNRGIDTALGKYIVRMDADDISLPNRLDVQYKYMEEHPDIDICGLKVKIFGEWSWDWVVESDPDKIRSDTLFFTPFVHPTVIMRKSKLDEYNLRYDENYFYTEDYEFFERAAEKLRYSNILTDTFFKYRVCTTNATTLGGAEGVSKFKSIIQRALERRGLELSSRENVLLCDLTFPIADSVEQALDDLAELDLLLKKIWWSDNVRQYYGEKPLFHTLHKRWMYARDKYHNTGYLGNDERINDAINRGFFAYKKFYENNMVKSIEYPLVTVVLPTFNSEKYIQDTVYSLLCQTYKNFELLIVNEFGSDDLTIHLVNMFNDKRIRIIQNTEKLGLADSLNEGIRQAKGKYVARADADDLYSSYRLEKQVAFMESHPDISLCGSWQRHFGRKNFIHACAQNSKLIKAKLLFNCDICHSTVLMRRKDFVDNDLWYDSNYLSEDFELWSRAVHKLNFYNIQEVLAEYRCNGDNITVSKYEQLDIESQKIVARGLKKLDISISDSEMVLLSGWAYPFLELSQTDREQILQRGDALLDKIKKQNSKFKIYDKKALKQVLDNRRDWMYGKVSDLIDKKEVPQNKKESSMIKKTIKKILKPLYHPFKWRFEDRLISLQNSNRSIEIKICDAQSENSKIISHLEKISQQLSDLEIGMRTLENKIDRLGVT